MSRIHFGTLTSVAELSGSEMRATVGGGWNPFKKKRTTKQKIKCAASVYNGAKTGAGIGGAYGPAGAVAGGVIGGVVGYRVGC
jgi:hypothetical protein